MQIALKALNHLVSDGIIESYAIGGAIGASFYLQAMQTEDIDVFVFLPHSSSGLVSLAPIYQALIALGGVIEREHVRFGDWPVQILPDANPLIAEAIRDAISVEYEGTATRIFRAEHLCAIALQTGRSKDYARVHMFLEQNAVMKESLSAVLGRYDFGQRLQRVLNVSASQKGGSDGYR